MAIHQHDLFMDVRRVRTARSLKEKRDGLARVASHNDQFLRRCREFAIGQCLINGEITIEQVRDFASCNALTPSHPNAWGAVFKSRGFKPVGFVPNTIVSAHARMVRVWTYGKP